MIVVYFGARTGSTHYAKTLADKQGIKYGNEIFWTGPFAKNPKFSIKELYDGYVDTFFNGFDKYKDCVVKINMSQVESISRYANISTNLLIKKINAAADHVHFCVRKNIQEQLKSTYALFYLVDYNTEMSPLEHDNFAHKSWQDSRHIGYNSNLLKNCKSIIRHNLDLIAKVYNVLPADKKTLAVYEEWAEESSRYKRPMTFEFDNFEVDFKLLDFFDAGSE